MMHEHTLPIPPSADVRTRAPVTRLFFSFLLTCTILFSAVAFWPAIKETVLNQSGSIKRSRPKPFYRTLPFRLSLGWLIVAGVLYARSWREARGRWQCSFAFCGAAVYNMALVMVYHQVLAEHSVAAAPVEFRDASENQWPNVQTMRIVEVPYTPAVNLRERLRARSDIHDFADLNRCAMEYYGADEPLLRKYVPGASSADEKKRKTWFIMNLVSGLWSFGNEKATSKSGCVFGNEDNRWQTPPINVRAYLDSKIGCCTDHAHLAKSLLDHEGIENRLTSIVGHIFNEVKLDGHWCIADATVNIYVDMSWQDLYERKHARDSIDVYVFPHANLNALDPSQYRSLAGHSRMVTLSRIANRPAHLAKTEHPKLPRYFLPVQ